MDRGSNRAVSNVYKGNRCTIVRERERERKRQSEREREREETFQTPEVVYNYIAHGTCGRKVVSGCSKECIGERV